MCNSYSKIICRNCNHEVDIIPHCILSGRKIDKDTIEAEVCFIRINPITNQLEKGCCNA